MLNVAVVMGRLTADPELRHTASGLSVTSFTLAVDRNYSKAGTERQTELDRRGSMAPDGGICVQIFHKGPDDGGERHHPDPEL